MHSSCACPYPQLELLQSPGLRALGLVGLGKCEYTKWSVKVSLTGSGELRSSGWKFQVTDRCWLIGLLLEKVHFSRRFVPFTAATSLEV